VLRRDLREGKIKGILVYGSWLIDPEDAERILREYPRKETTYA